MEWKAECLAHILAEGLQCLVPEGVKGILEVPFTRTEGEL